MLGDGDVLLADLNLDLVHDFLPLLLLLLKPALELTLAFLQLLHLHSRLSILYLYLLMIRGNTKIETNMKLLHKLFQVIIL